MAEDEAPVPSLVSFDQRLHKPADRLRQLVSIVDDDEFPDEYGTGGAVQRLEQRVATLLGKPAALFMPTGAMASQVALRLHADARASRVVGFHPHAHIEVHECKGYSVVHQLIGKHLCRHHSLFTLDDLHAVREPLAAVLWELPQRDLGGLLPEWDDLVAQTSWARQHGIAAHLDGARLWEAQPYYRRSHADIAALFDTVYVSLYKGLHALGSAILAGPAELIAHAQEWRARLGGQLHEAWPIALSALDGLDRYLPQMDTLWTRAREIAAVLREVDGVRVVPPVPQTPLFHLHFDVPHAALRAAQDEILDGGVQVFAYGGTGLHPGCSRVEITISENAMKVPVGDVRDTVADLIGRARDHQKQST